ncbi:MAG: hypothetical protein QXH35_03620 [Nitrososphaerota archaeon]
MANIRFRYTGLTAYMASLITMLTGLAFTLLITRRLTPAELGVWRYVGTLISYFVAPAAFIGFWATRMTAQGKTILGTTMMLATLFSSLATLLFITFSNIFASSVDFPATVFLMAALEIPAIYVYTVLESTATAIRPHTNYYASIIQEVVKLPIGIILVLLLRLGLSGALLAAVVGFASRATAMALFLRDVKWGSPDKSTAVNILSKAWLPLYSSIPPSIGALDAVIIVILYRTAEPLGYLSAVNLIGSIVTASGNLAAALYPRMLQSPSHKDVEASLRLVFMSAIPTATGALILSQNLLNLLRPEYVGAATLIPLALIQAMIFIVNSIFDSVIIGGERADFGEETDIRKILKSRLFLLPTINYLSSALYLATLVTVLYLISPTDLFEILFLWLSISAASALGLTVYKLRLARKNMKFILPFHSFIRYLTASIVMGLVLLVLRPSSLPKEIINALSQTLIPVVIGAATYFVSLYPLDKEFRDMVKTILRTLGLL